MTGDELADKAGDRLQDLAEKAKSKGGVAAKLAKPLAEDAAFVRKLKPRLMAARARGEAPTDQEPGPHVVEPAGPQPRKRPKGDGPSPFAVVGAALAAGIALAKLIDWRGHAHPRR